MKTIFLDSRESDSKFISLFIDTVGEQGYDVHIEALPFGDIKYENIIIEKKEINDYYSSVTSDRMWTQIAHMRTNSEYSSIIMISGRIEDLWKINDDKISIVMGSQKKIIALGIPLIWCFTNEEFIFKCLELFEYATSADKFVPIKRVEKNKKDSLFMALPAVGRKNAKALMKKYSCMCTLCEAPKKELVALLGPKRGSDIYNALRD